MSPFRAYLIVFFYSLSSLAWGLRGHDTICQAATFLTQPAKLQSFLKDRGPQMGHLCNIPDTHWRSLPGPAKELGGPTHFMDIDLLGVPIDQIPLDFAKIAEIFDGKPSPGSMWWRADQFYRRAIEQGAKNSIFEMLNSMGLMGHYVGDAGQPFHSTADYDGIAAGHKGIHGYYEHEVVAEIDAKLLGDVVARAEKLKKSWKPKGSVIEKMRELSKISYPEIKKIYVLDKIDKQGKRELTEKIVKSYRPLIVEQMARSTVLLAELWTEIFEKANSPDILAYKSYEFPFQPDFVAPDYLKADKK